MDGAILDEALRSSGNKSREWLQLELDKLEVTLHNVFLGQLNTYGELTVDIYDDKLKVPSPIQCPLLLASLKKTQADLEIQQNVKNRKRFMKKILQKYKE